MEKFYRIQVGMHEHPQSYKERGYKAPRGAEGSDHQLLFPGDVVKVEEALILRPPVMGGWADPQKDGTWRIQCAVEVEGIDRETFVLRDEPSRISGVNITDQALQRLEREESEGEAVIIPAMSVARDAPSAVKRVRA